MSDDRAVSADRCGDCVTARSVGDKGCLRHAYPPSADRRGESVLTLQQRAVYDRAALSVPPHRVRRLARLRRWVELWVDPDGHVHDTYCECDCCVVGRH